MSNIRRKSLSTWARQLEALCPLCWEYRGVASNGANLRLRNPAGLVVKRCLPCYRRQLDARGWWADVGGPNRDRFCVVRTTKVLRRATVTRDRIRGTFGSRLVARAIASALNDA